LRLLSDRCVKQRWQMEDDPFAISHLPFAILYCGGVAGGV
jgi:hypothetical protein